MVSFREGLTRRQFWAQLTWPGIWAFITAVGLWLTPNASGHGTHMQLGLPPCPSVFLWNRPCPGCGLTTSIAAFLHGDFALAWSSHPFGPIAYILLTMLAIACVYGAARNLRLDCSTRAFNIGIVLLFVLYLGHGAARFILSKGLDDPFNFAYRASAAQDAKR